jgi:hypothetical protein
VQRATDVAMPAIKTPAKQPAALCTTTHNTFTARSKQAQLYNRAVIWPQQHESTVTAAL